MNIVPQNGRYLVYAPGDPERRRFFVTRGRKCTCGLEECEHVQAVVEYLKKGGKRAEGETCDPRGSLAEALERYRRARERAISEGTLSDGTKAILEAHNAPREVK